MAALVVALMALPCRRGALADENPRCWQRDQPDKKLEVDGEFRIFIPTRAHSAQDVATVVVILEYSVLGAIVGVGITSNLDRIEIDIVADITHWQPSGAHPTLNSFKDAIQHSLDPVLQVSRVRVECYYHHPFRHPPLPIRAGHRTWVGTRHEELQWA